MLALTASNSTLFGIAAVVVIIAAVLWIVRR